MVARADRFMTTNLGCQNKAGPKKSSLENMRGDFMSQTIRICRWAKLFSGEAGYFAVFHSLNLEVVFLEQKFREMIELLFLGTTLDFLTRKFEKLTEIPEIIAELSRYGLIVPVENDDMTLLEEKRKVHVLPPGLETLYLIVADDCNLACGYCFILNNMPEDYRSRRMSFATAKAAIDMYFGNLVRNPPGYEKLRKTIYFYGGEPLLNFRLIKQVVEYLEHQYKDQISEMGEKFRMSIVTNGTLISKEIAQFVAARGNFDIAISLDGQEESHNKKRPFINGKGSFEKAIRGLEILKQEGKKEISLSCTIADHNIDELPSLLDLHRKYGFASINLNPLVDTAKDPVSKKYMWKVSKRMIEYFTLAREEGVYEDRMMRKTKSFVEKKIHAYDCQALGAQLVCSPDGQLGVCHEGTGIKQFFFATVDKDFDFHKNTVIAEWKQRTPLNMPQCYDCPALGICGGGCAYGSWLRNGSIWSVDDRFCVHSRTTLEWLVWDLFSRL